MSIRVRISGAARAIRVASRQRRFRAPGWARDQNGFTSSSICSTILPQSVLRNLNFPVSPMTFSCCVSVLSTNGYGFALLLPHEGLHFLKGHFAVLVGVDPIKDPLMDGHHLLEGECPVPVRVDNGEHDLHHVSTRTHHRHSAHHAVSHHARAHHPRLGGRRTWLSGLHHPRLSRCRPRRSRDHARCGGVHTRLSGRNAWG